MPGRSSPEWELFAGWSGTLADLGGTAGLLGWDRETVMPRAGAEGRARQLGTLAALHHRELVRADAGAAIDALREDGELDDDARAMLRLALRERERALRVPEELVREITEACSRSTSAWIEARKADDFAAFAGPLRRVVELKRLQAEVRSMERNRKQRRAAGPKLRVIPGGGAEPDDYEPPDKSALN